MMARQEVVDVEAIRRDAVAEERERVARDLHDGIVRSLFGVGLMLQAAASELDDDRVRLRLEEAIAGLDDAVRELREHLFRG